MMRALDALETVLSAYIGNGKAVPKPSRVGKGDKFVGLPALSEAKICLYEAMRAGKIRKSELARRLNWHLPQVDRLLDPGQASRADQLEQAFRALGKQLSIQIRDAA